MTDWTSIADIAREFGLHQYETDAPALRDGLKRAMSSVHPDRNGGSFKSDQEKAQFMRTKAALDYLELQSQSGLALIPLSQLPAIVRAVSQALTALPALDSHALQSNYMADAKARITRRFVLPKIGSGVFAAITAFLVAFPDKFEKHPILGPILGERITQLVLLSMVAYSGLFFMLTWYRERQEEARVEYLMSERALGDLFEMLNRHESLSVSSRRLSSRQIMDEIQNLAGYRAHSRPFFIAFLGSSVDLPTLEKMASIQTQRLMERKLLTRVDIAALDTWYDLHSGFTSNA